MLEPSDSAEARAFAMQAYEISETYHTPVFLKMCTRIAHSQSVVETGERVERPVIPYQKDPARVMMTKNSMQAHILSLIHI